MGLPAASFLLRSDSSGFDWWLLLGIPILVVLCVPQLLNAIIDRTLRLLKREPLEHSLSAGAVLRAVVIFVLVWIAFGGTRCCSPERSPAKGPRIPTSPQRP